VDVPVAGGGELVTGGGGLVDGGGELVTGGGELVTGGGGLVDGGGELGPDGVVLAGRGVDEAGAGVEAAAGGALDAVVRAALTGPTAPGCWVTFVRTVLPCDVVVVQTTCGGPSIVTGVPRPTEPPGLAVLSVRATLGGSAAKVSCGELTTTLIASTPPVGDDCVASLR
jgi:hypothetical protein